MNTETKHDEIFAYLYHIEITIFYRKGTSIRQAPVFRHLRALRKNPWKFINFMNEL